MKLDENRVDYFEVQHLKFYKPSFGDFEVVNFPNFTKCHRPILNKGRQTQKMHVRHLMMALS